MRNVQNRNLNATKGRSLRIANVYSQGDIIRMKNKTDARSGGEFVKLLKGPTDKAQDPIEYLASAARAVVELILERHESFSILGNDTSGGG